MKAEQRIQLVYPQKLARDIIVRLARPINKRLLMLVGFDFPAEPRQHFRRELRSWFTEIQAIRLKPTMRTGSFRFYFDPLFDYPFGGVEVQNVRGLVELISRQYDRNPTKRRRSSRNGWSASTPRLRSGYIKEKPSSI
jgi:hypothetical protein